MTRSLASLFGQGASPELEAALARMLDRCLARWPGFAVEVEPFVLSLAKQIPSDRAADDWLERLHAEDLYLAWACGCGDEVALRAFEAEHVPALVAEVERRGGDPARVADVVQTMRTRLLVGPAPKIATYSGRGPLRAWLRIIATRVLLDLAPAPSRLEEEEAIWDLPSPGDHPDVELWRRDSRAAFRAAVTEALEALSPRERTILAQYYLDGTTLQQLGTLYRVHTATAGRWLARARQVVLERTRALLAERVGLAGAELDSALRSLRSNLDLSLSRLLRDSH